MRRRKRKKKPDLRYDLNEFRVWMGPLAYKLNDIQLREMQRQMNELARLLINLWEIKHGLQNPDGPDEFDREPA